MKFKKYYSLIAIFLIFIGFLSILLFSKSRLNVLSIFIDNVRIHNSKEVVKNGISFGKGDDDIFIDFVPKKGCVISPNDSLSLADSVILVLNKKLLNSFPLNDNDTICIMDSSEQVFLTFKKNKIWEKDSLLAELEERGWRGAIYPLSNIRNFKVTIHSFIYFDDGSARLLILDNHDKLILLHGKEKKYVKKDRFYIPLQEKNNLQFRKIFQRYVSKIDKKTERLIAEKKVFKISSIKKDFEINLNSKGFNINFVKPIKQNIRLDDILNLKSTSVVLTFGTLSHYGFNNVVIPKFVGKISDLTVRLDFKSHIKKDKVLVMDPHISDPEKSTYLIPYGKLTITDDNTEIDIWIIKLAVPWNMIVFYLGIILLFCLLYFRLFTGLLNENPKTFNHLILLLSACILFLSFRLLFSYKAFIQYPFRVDFYRDAIFGLVFVPFLILELIDTENSFWKTFGRAFILLIPTAVFLYELSMLSSEILGKELFQGKMLGLAIIMLIFKYIKLAFIRIIEAFGEVKFTWKMCLIILIVALILRLGIKESIPILSIRASFIANLFIIGFLLGFINNYTNQKHPTKLDFFRIILFAFIYFALNAGVSGDLGYIMYFVSVPFILIYLGFLSQKNDVKKISIYSGLFLVLILVLGTFYIGKIALYLSDLERVGMIENFQTRLLGFTDFSLLKEQGYRNTEIFTQFFEKIRFYASSGFWGRGYLHSPLGRESNWFNDNVPASFLMSEFGLFGVLLVFIAYISILAFIIPGYDSVFKPAGTNYRLLKWKFLGIVAASMLIFPSVYMIFANVGLVPFTGKNVFLFGLDSYSDLMESAILFGLTAKGITTKND